MVKLCSTAGACPWATTVCVVPTNAVCATAASVPAASARMTSGTLGRARRKRAARCDLIFYPLLISAGLPRQLEAGQRRAGLVGACDARRAGERCCEILTGACPLAETELGHPEMKTDDV